MVEPPRGEDDPRVAELLRVNGELAVEIRDLSLGRRERPRSAQVPAARSVAKLQAERDQLAEQLEASRAEVDRLTRNDEDQTRRIEELTAEVALLRGGFAGVLRRARARLLLNR
jgi:chromosome segregation ATPase